jgi:hypothetical protein
MLNLLQEEDDLWGSCAHEGFGGLGKGNTSEEKVVSFEGWILGGGT